MSNFKIAHANLKDPNISSLRMNHFKIAHISTWLATIRPSFWIRYITTTLFLLLAGSKLFSLKADSSEKRRTIENDIHVVAAPKSAIIHLKRNICLRYPV